MAAEYLERLHPRSGCECQCGATYRNAMIGRPETPYADHGWSLRQRGQHDLAGLIERHHDEQHNLAFFDFFPAMRGVYRIDQRTTSPRGGWQLDQDRSGEAGARYDSWGYVV